MPAGNTRRKMCSAGPTNWPFGNESWRAGSRSRCRWILRPAVFDVRGDNSEVPLPAALVKALEALARREGVTLHAVMLAGFMLLLARYSGQNDVMVGTPLANRNRPELGNLIGFFVNTLPLRRQIDPVRALPSLCERLRPRRCGRSSIRRCRWRRWWTLWRCRATFRGIRCSRSCSRWRARAAHRRVRTGCRWSI
ncbi:condensation domain-containing protein [Serratia ureilytica]